MKKQLQTKQDFEAMIAILQNMKKKESIEEVSCSLEKEEAYPAPEKPKESEVSPNEAGKASTAEDDCWSDDDLFQDSSLIIEMSQNPEKFLPSAKAVTATQRNSNSSSLDDYHSINLWRIKYKHAKFSIWICKK